MNMLPQFVSAGEALTDMIRSGPDQWTSQTGGAGLNVARAMARLGVVSAFAGAVSTDVFGQAVMNSATQARLDTRFLQTYPKSPLLAIVHETAPPDYFFIGSDSADLHFNPARLPQGWDSAVRCVHFGGISLARPPLADRLIKLAARLKAKGVRISYDPNYRKLMDARYDPVLTTMGRLADIIKVSDEDLLGLFRTDDVDLAFARLRAINPQAGILFTRGAAGAQFHAGGRTWLAPAPAIDVVDTIGAGDASISALLYSLIHRVDVDGAEHLRFAVAAGAAACTQAGATPPSLGQVVDLAANVTVTSLVEGTA